MRTIFRIVICFLFVSHSGVSELFAQCAPNTIEFNGSQKIFNTACENNSYQTIDGSTPSGTGNTFRWEVSYSAAAFTTIVNASNGPITSRDLAKNDITNFVLAPNANASGDYRIRRIVTNASAGCVNTSEPVSLYYAQNSAATTGGTILGETLVCSPASGTLTVAGNTGPILRWESSTNGSDPWTPISNTTRSLSYSGITSTTYFRALSDNICVGTPGSIDPLDKYSTTLIITVNSAPVITQQPVNQTICLGAALNLSVTASSPLAITYQWRKNGADINGAVSASFSIPSVSNSDAGSYDVLITNTCGSVTSNAAVVTVSPIPIANIPSNSTVCPGAAVPLAAFTSSPTGASFLWTNSNTGIGLAASGSGNVPAFTATNPTTSPITATITVIPVLNGCAGPASSYIITVNPTATVTVPADLEICSGAIVSATNFSSMPSGATYSWTNSNTAIGLADASGLGNIPSFTATNTSSSPVFTTITVTPFVNGCAGTPTSYTITVNPLPAFSTLIGNESACGADDGSINFTATGTGPFEYSINGGLNYQPSSSFTGLAAGSYSVVVRNSTGCITETIVAVLSPGAPPPVPIDQGTNPMCEGPDLILSVPNPDPLVTYTWIGPNGYTDIGPMVTRPNAVPSMSGTYAVTPSSSGCVGTSTIFTVTVKPRPVATVPSNSTYCAGEIVPVGALISTPAGSTYTWSNSNTNIGLIASGNTDIPSFTATNTTNSPIVATITVIPTLNGCTGDAVSYTITVNPTPVVDTQLDVVACHGSTVPARSFTSNVAGTTYTWTITGLGSAISGSGPVNSFTAFNPGSTPIVGTVTVTPQFNGCAGPSTNYTITVNPIPRVTNVPLNQTVCSGTATEEVVMASDVAGATFSWTAVASSADVTGFALSGPGNIPPQFISTSGSTQETVTYTITPMANGCPGLPSTYVIRVNPLPALSNSITLSQTICSGSSSTAVNLTSDVAGTSFTWTAIASSGSIIGFQSSGTGDILSQTILNTGNTPGTVTYTIIPDASNCNGPVSTYTIHINPLPTATISGNATVCYGADAVLSVALTGTAPWAITYSDGTSTFNLSGINTSAFNFTVSATATKTYTIVSVTDALCSNSGAGSATVTQPLAALNALATGNNVTCFGAGNGSIVFNAASGGSGSYQYSIDGGTTWQAGTTFSGLSPGSYNLQVRDMANNNCIAVINTALLITQPSAPLSAVISSQANVFCFGASTGSVNLAVTGGTAPYTYLWSNGSTSADLTNLPAGSYTVSISDAQGCSIAGPLQVTITQPSSALNAAASSSNVTCFGGTNGSITITNVSGGAGTYEYSINGGSSWQNGTSFINLPAGTYLVQIRDAASPSCVFTVDAARVITQAAPLSATASSSNTSCFGSSDGTITVANMSGGSGAYEFSMNNGNSWQISNSFNGLLAGTYTIQVRDRADPACVFTIAGNLTIIQPSVLSATVESLNVSCRGANNGSIRVVNSSGGYGNYEYSISGGLNWQASPIFSSLGPGIYNVQVRDALNPSCVQILGSSVAIREAAEPLESAITSQMNINCFGASTGSVLLFVRGGVAPYSYAWSNGSTSRDLTNVPAGIYTVNITDSYNCVSTQTISITQPASPLSISFSKKDVSCFGANNGSITISATGGTAPYTYRWNDGRITKDITNLNARLYTITVVDSKGCSISQQITIDQPALTLGLELTRTNVSCFGGNDGSVRSRVTGGTAPYTYNWSNGQKTSDVSGLAPGNYNVTIFDANGCSINQIFTVTQPAAALKASLSIKNTVCRTSSDGSITAIISGGTTPYRVSWKGHPGTTNLISNLKAGVYELMVTDANGCILTLPAEVKAGICPPVAIDDQFKTYQDESLTGSAAPNDFDRENEALSFSLTLQPKNGKIVFKTDGSFTYTPNPGFWGIEIIPYRICNTSGVCSSAAITIDVIPFTIVNLTPAISNVSEGRKISVTATLVQPYIDDVVIKLSYSGIAIKDLDYVLLDQFLQITIPKGKLTTTQKITIAALTDNLQEGNEVLNIQIAATSHPEVRIGSGAMVNIDDIYPPAPVPPVESKEVPANTDLTIDPLISPNGDGQGNETFIIDNIVSFPDNEVVIFNRWGNEVFRMKGYNQSDRVFKGYANTGLLTNTNTALVDGVYYYLITTRRTINGEVVTALNKGYLILKR